MAPPELVPPDRPRVDAGDHLEPSAVLGLRDVLMPAYSPTGLAELLMLLNRSPTDFATRQTPHPEATLAAVQAASEQNWWRQLLAAARKTRPLDPALEAFGEEFDLAPVPIQTEAPGRSRRVRRAALEGLVRASNELLDIAVWRSRLGAVESRVCRVECPAGTPRGTGFLVARDVVITNFHVVHGLFGNEWPAASVALRFDHKVRPDGVTVDAGVVHHLANDWLVDASPFSAFDLSDAPAGDPSDDELDYALLRLAAQPGLDRVGSEDRRGWIIVPEPAPPAEDLSPGRPLFIVQHADGQAMKVALDTDAIQGKAGKGTRLRYSTNTLHGSSGSPCFNASWQWIALHHSGDPKYTESGMPTRYNQGILVTAIANLLARRGKRAILEP